MKTGQKQSSSWRDLILTNRHCRTHKHTYVIMSTHYRIPGNGMSALFMHNAAPLRRLSSMMLILFCMNLSHSFPFIFMFVSLPLERLIKVCDVFLFSDSSALLLYLFTFWWGSHTSVCWEGILISCNFPALTCMRVKCGIRRRQVGFL